MAFTTQFAQKDKYYYFHPVEKLWYQDSQHKHPHCTHKIHFGTNIYYLFKQLCYTTKAYFRIQKLMVSWSNLIKATRVFCFFFFICFFFILFTILEFMVALLQELEVVLYNQTTNENKMCKTKNRFLHRNQEQPNHFFCNWTEIWNRECYIILYSFPKMTISSWHCFLKYCIHQPLDITKFVLWNWIYEPFFSHNSINIFGDNKLRRIINIS